MAPDPAALAREVQALRQSLIDLNRVMGRLVEEKVTEVAVPRAEFHHILRRNWLVGLAVIALLAAGLVANRVTYVVSQRTFADQVTTCFLRPGAITEAQAAGCIKRFGPEYRAVQQRSRQATAQFTSLQEWAKQRGWKPPPTATGK